MNYLFEDVEPYLTNTLPVLNNTAILAPYEKTLNNPRKEYVCYGWMNTILSEVFKSSGGYIVEPPSRETLGEPDFIIYLNNIVVGIVECKAEQNYTWTELYSQNIMWTK